MADRPANGPASQTLSRGIRLLEILAGQTEPMSIATAAAQLGVHRSIAYRIVRTLEDHSLVERDDGGNLHLAAGLAALAQHVAKDLQAAARPELGAVADELGMTAFLVVLENTTCITLLSAEPREGPGTVSRRPGARHPLEKGASGVAIQSAMSDPELTALFGGRGIRPEVGLTRSRGYAVSRNEVIEGLTGVSVPLIAPGRPPGAVSVVYIATPFDNEAIGARLRQAAGAIASRLG